MNFQSYLDSRNIADNDYDPETGLPINQKYLECFLPPYLQ